MLRRVLTLRAGGLRWRQRLHGAAAFDGDRVPRGRRTTAGAR